MWGLGSRVQGVGFRVQGVGCWISGFGLRLYHVCLVAVGPFPLLERKLLFMFRAQGLFSASGTIFKSKNNYFAEMCSGSDEGSYARSIDLCYTQL